MDWISDYVQMARKFLAGDDRAGIGLIVLGVILLFHPIVTTSWPPRVDTYTYVGTALVAIGLVLARRWALGDNNRAGIGLIAFGIVLALHLILSPWWPPRLDLYTYIGIAFIVLGLALARQWSTHLIQFSIIILGLSLAAIHAVQNGSWPLLIDSLTYTGIGIAVFGLVLPRIKGFKFGDVSFDLTETIVENANFAYLRSVELTETWMISLSALNRQYQLAKSRAEAQAALLRFCIEALSETLLVIAFPKEVVRLSIWLYNAEARELQFLVSNDEDRNQRAQRGYKIGEGLIGQAFVQNAEYQTDDAANEPFYRPPNNKKTRYSGLLMEMIRFGNTETYGILAIDRSEKAFFPPENTATARALAQIISVALSHPGLRRWLTLLPPDVESQLPAWPPV
jgi:GAF domain-containing protein